MCRKCLRQFPLSAGRTGTLSFAAPLLVNLEGRPLILISSSAGQMQHFVKDDGMNTFRLPVTWQYLVNNKVGGTLDSGNSGKYDQLVQACLSAGAYCMIDVSL